MEWLTVADAFKMSSKIKTGSSGVGHREANRRSRERVPEFGWRSERKLGK